MGTMDKNGNDIEEGKIVSTTNSSSKSIGVYDLNYEYDPSSGEFSEPNMDDCSDKLDYDALIDAYSVNNEKLRNLEEENLMIREELQNEQSFNENLKKILEHRNRTIEKDNRNFIELQQENDKHQEQILLLEQKVAKLKSQSVKYKKEIKQFEEKVSSVETDKEELLNTKEKLTQLTKSQSLVEKEICSITEKYDEKCEECNSLQEKISNLSNIAIELQKSMKESEIIYKSNIDEKNNMLLSLQIFDDEILSRSPKTHETYNSSNNSIESNEIYKVVNSTALGDRITDDSMNLQLELSQIGESIGCCKDDSKYHNLEEKYSLLNSSICDLADAFDKILHEIIPDKNKMDSLQQQSDANTSKSNFPKVDQIFNSLDLFSDWAKSISKSEKETQTIFSGMIPDESKPILSTSLTLDQVSESDDSKLKSLTSTDFLLQTPLRSSNDESTKTTEMVFNNAESSTKMPSNLEPAMFMRRKLSVYDSNFQVQEHKVKVKELTKSYEGDLAKTPDNPKWTKYRISNIIEGDSPEGASPLEKLTLDSFALESKPVKVSDISLNNINVSIAPSKFKVSGNCPETVTRSPPSINLHLNFSDPVKGDKFRNITFRKNNDDPHDPPKPAVKRLPFTLPKSKLQISDTQNDAPKNEVMSDLPTCAVVAASESEKVKFTETAVPLAMSNGECDKSSALSATMTFESATKRGTSDETGRRDRRVRTETMKRSASENDVKQVDNACEKLTNEKVEPFPGLTDLKLASLTNNSNLTSDSIDTAALEKNLERKYTSFSICLAADRMTLSRRVSLAFKQRNQAENNLTAEIQRLKEDIQDLTSFCVDKESIEKIEKARHQLHMIEKCTHTVSCSAETLGAIRQENRISTAVLLADKYLQILRAKCEKLLSEVTETKRILAESNVVLEENPNEIGDDVPRIRYRTVNSNNRTMMARRRASIATMSRPMTSTSETTKEYSPKQRNSICGRVSSRRPSFNYERQSNDTERLDRTESATNINDTREIVDIIHTRQDSREENHLLQRQCNGNGDGPICMRDNISELPIVHEMQVDSETNYWTVPSTVARNKRLKKVVILISIFLFLFILIKYLFSLNLCIDKPCEWWSIEDIIKNYIELKNVGPKAI